MNGITTNRILVLASACFQEQGRQPGSARDDRISWACRTDNQPYARTLRVGAGWQRLDLGWLEEDGAPTCGLLWLSNEEGKRWERYPTPAERASVEGRIVEVGVQVRQSGDDGVWLPCGLLVPLRAPLVMVPADPGNVWLRCPALGAETVPGGKPPKATVTLTAYPA